MHHVWARETYYSMRKRPSREPFQKDETAGIINQLHVMHCICLLLPLQATPPQRAQSFANTVVESAAIHDQLTRLFI